MNYSIDAELLSISSNIDKTLKETASSKNSATAHKSNQNFNYNKVERQGGRWREMEGEGGKWREREGEGGKGREKEGEGERRWREEMERGDGGKCHKYTQTNRQISVPDYEGTTI